MPDRVGLALAVGLAGALVVGCSPSGPRDVAGEDKDLRVAEPGPAASGGAGRGEAYEYVARIPHGVVALAEARNMSPADAQSIVERIAADLEACATKLEQEHLLVKGAARIVAVAQPNGPPALNVRLAPGGAVAQNALLCLVAPVRATAFPKAGGAGAPGLAIEATWGPSTPPGGETTTDGGPPH